MEIYYETHDWLDNFIFVIVKVSMGDILLFVSILPAQYAGKIDRWNVMAIYSIINFIIKPQWLEKYN